MLFLLLAIATVTHGNQACTRPSGWCGGTATYSLEDCDGDGIKDPVCRGSSGELGVIQSSADCADPIGAYPNAVCGCALTVTSHESNLGAGHAALGTPAYELLNDMSKATMENAGSWDAGCNGFIASGASCTFTPKKYDTGFTNPRYKCDYINADTSRGAEFGHDSPLTATCNAGVLDKVPDCQLDDNKKVPNALEEAAATRVRGYGNRNTDLTGRPNVAASDFDDNDCIRAGPGNGILLPSVDMSMSDITGDVSITVTFPLHAWDASARLGDNYLVPNSQGLPTLANWADQTDKCMQTLSDTYKWQAVQNEMEVSDTCNAGVDGGTYVYEDVFVVHIYEPYDPAMQWEEVDDFEANAPNRVSWATRVGVDSYTGHEILMREHTSDYLVRITVPCTVCIDASKIHVHNDISEPFCDGACIRCTDQCSHGFNATGSTANEKAASCTKSTNGFGALNERISSCAGQDVLPGHVKCLDAKKDSNSGDTDFTFNYCLPNSNKITNPHNVFDKEGPSLSNVVDCVDDMSNFGACCTLVPANQCTFQRQPPCDSKKDKKCRIFNAGGFTVQDTVLHLDESTMGMTLTMEVLTEIDWPWEVTNPKIKYYNDVYDNAGSGSYVDLTDIKEDTNMKACTWETVYCYQLWDVTMKVDYNKCGQTMQDTLDWDSDVIITKALDAKYKYGDLINDSVTNENEGNKAPQSDIITTISGTIDIPPVDMACRFDLEANPTAELKTYMDEALTTEHTLFLENTWVYFKTVNGFHSIVHTATIYEVTAKMQGSGFETKVTLSDSLLYRGNGATKPGSTNTGACHYGDTCSSDDFDKTDDNKVQFGLLLQPAFFNKQCTNHYGCLIEFDACIELTYNAGRRRLITATAGQGMSDKGKAVAVVLGKPTKKKDSYKCEQKKSYKGCMAAAKASKKGKKKGPVDGPCYWKSKKCFGTNKQKDPYTVLDGVNKRMCKTLEQIGCYVHKEENKYECRCK